MKIFDQMARIPLFLLGLALWPAQGLMAEPVDWTHTVRVEADGGWLTKTSDCDGCSDSGAVSQRQMGPPGGYVEFTVPDARQTLYAGISSDRGAGTGHEDIDYAIRVQNGMAEVRENNRYLTTIPANDGDRYRIQVSEDTVSYYRNGENVHQSQASPSWPVGMDVALLSRNARLADAVIVPGGRAGGEQFSDGNFFWSNVVNARAQERSLTKVGGCDGCEDAGATSRNRLDRGNVRVEFTVPDVDKILYVGISNGNEGTGFREIDFALRFQGGTAEVRENNQYRAEIEARDGDRFRITVLDGQVSYHRLRGERHFYTSEQSPQYPLLVDVSLLSAGAALENVRHNPF